MPLRTSMTSLSARPNIRIPRLAAELIDRIIDFLHNDWRTLVACVLTGVHSPFAPCAKYHLSNGIDLLLSRSPAELDEFMRVFRFRSSLARLVKSIHIRGTRTRPLVATLPIYVDLSYLPNLRAVTLSYLYIESNEGLVRFLCKIPALKELACEGLLTQPFGGPMYLRRGASKRKAELLSTQEKAAFGRRLTSLTLIENMPPHPFASSSPYGSIEQVLQVSINAGCRLRLRIAVIHIRSAVGWTSWLWPFCLHNTCLEVLDLLVDSPLGTAEDLFEESIGQGYTRCLSIALLYWPFLHTLCIRYYPWELRQGAPGAMSAEATSCFLHAISKALNKLSSFAEEHRQNGAHWPGLVSLELVLPAIPPYTQADAEAFAALARSLKPTRWPRLTRVKIAIEPMPPSDLNADTVGRWRASVSSAATQEALEGCAVVARGALSALADDKVHGRRIEVIVCNQPANEIPS